MGAQEVYKKNNNAINPHELRRKFIKISKELFISPIEDGVVSKSKAPLKRQVFSKLTKDEKEYLKKNPDIVFPKDMPERLIWDVFAKRNMKMRREILLRVVAEDNALIEEKEIISNQGSEEKKLPSRKQVLEKLSSDERAILIEYDTPILSTTKLLDKLCSSDRLYFLVNGKLPVQDLEKSERQNIYMEHVSEQKEFFELYLEFINKLLSELRKCSQVQEGTIMTARIKGTDSALRNDPKKALDDIFGIETIYSNYFEKSIIEQIVASTLDITQEKQKNKSNGYKAYHISGTPTDLDKQFEETKLYKKLHELYKDEMFYPNLSYYVGEFWESYKAEMIEKLKTSWKKYDDSNNQDINTIINNLMLYVEVQSKTMSKAMKAIHGSEDDISAAHYVYEALDKGDVSEELSNEEIEIRVNKFKKNIQEKYTNIIKANDGELPASTVPWMKKYMLDGSSKVLNPIETLRHIYPFFIDPSYLEPPVNKRGGNLKVDNNKGR